jgi:hypothetical protein
MDSRLRGNDRGDYYCYNGRIMIIAKYLKSYKTIVTLGVLVALIPLLGIPSWIRDMITYILGLCIAFGTYRLHKEPVECSTFKESQVNVTVGIINETKEDISTLNKE